MTKSIQKRCILFVGMLGLMMACAKEKTTNPSPPREIETLQPSNYLMAYPKSWWIYVDTKGGQPVKIQTGEAFELDSAPVRPQNEPYVDYVVKKVPRYNGLPLWGNQKHVGDLHPFITIERIYDTNTRLFKYHYRNKVVQR
jgi:hypothetical protein